MVSGAGEDVVPSGVYHREHKGRELEAMCADAQASVARESQHVTIVCGYQ